MCNLIVDLLLMLEIELMGKIQTMLFSEVMRKALVEKKKKEEWKMDIENDWYLWEVEEEKLKWDLSEVLMMIFRLKMMNDDVLLEEIQMVLICFALNNELKR